MPEIVAFAAKAAGGGKIRDSAFASDAEFWVVLRSDIRVSNFYSLIEIINEVIGKP
jgi:uncharacterized membrane protein YeiH